MLNVKLSLVVPSYLYDYFRLFCILLGNQVQQEDYEIRNHNDFTKFLNLPDTQLPHL